MAMQNPEQLTALNTVFKLIAQLSPDEQEQIRLKLNSTWVLRPKNKAMDQLRKEAQHALNHAGVTVDELKQEVERIKEERLAQRYPGLGE